MGSQAPVSGDGAPLDSRLRRLPEARSGTSAPAAQTVTKKLIAN
jgi:hypothetical protein